MRNFDKLLQESSTIHGHHCAGQVLGVRMAMLGCREVGIDEPKGCKKLVVYVEMDRCATDAMQAVTGCSLGKRTLKFLDYGKMAATFVNTETGKAVRVLAKDDARALTPSFAPGAATPREAQKQAYRVMPEDT
jgi:formylmethanofuran dehydrogenase subunit E